jgi:hypothetical protein
VIVLFIIPELGCCIYNHYSGAGLLCGFFIISELGWWPDYSLFRGLAGVWFESWKGF